MVQPLLDAPPHVEVYEQGTWGPTSADGLVKDYRSWHDPWMPS